MTHQPVHGRKKGGGIRFGEMERDSLLAHGSSFLLHDRLFKCSDATVGYGCDKCGSILSTSIMNQEGDANPADVKSYTCKICETPKHVVKVSLPYVLKYLVSELASVNIKVNFKFKSLDERGQLTEGVK
jgi:DNA-directed RNA polymerase I subunit RPA2